MLAQEIEPSVQVALIGLIGIVITAIGGAFVALSTNRKEKTMVAESTLEKAYEQRILLRDEQLAESRQDVQDLLKERSELVAKLTTTYEKNARLEAELAKLKEKDNEPSK